MNPAGEQAHRDRQSEARSPRECLDEIIRQALQLWVGNAGPSARAWTEIRERIECSPQSDLAGEDKSPSSIESQDTR